MRHKWVFLLALLFQMPVVAQNDTIIRHYNDTVIRTVTDTVVSTVEVPDSVAKQREVVIAADSTDRRGHYIQAHVGLGYGSLGYKLEGPDNRVHGSFSALLQLQYAYFFHPNWGVGAGLWFTNYVSYAHIGGRYHWQDQTDTDYANTQDRHTFAFGIGYRGSMFYADLAYKLDTYNSNMYPFVVKDGHTIYPSARSVTKVTNTRNQAMLTLGVRF